MSDKFKLQLLGPLQLHRPDGTDVTPRGAKTQGMMAILAVAKGRPCHRPAIQDKLWSDRGETQGRSSLRQSLRELRACFGSLGKEIIVSDGGPIRLDLAKLNVDIFADEAFSPADGLPVPDFLEGISIRDEQFEEWLREIRSSLSGKIAASRPPVRFVDTGARQLDCLRLAITPIVHSEMDRIARIVGDLTLNRMSMALKNHELFEVLDMRFAEAGGPAGSDLEIFSTAINAGGDVVLSFSVRRVSDSAIVMGQETTVEVAQMSGERVGVFVSEFVDRLTFAAFRPEVLGDPEQHLAARHAMEGVVRMLRLSPDDLSSAATSFRKAVELHPKSTYQAWFAFLTAFRLEDTKGTNLSELREHADTLATRAIDLDPYNPLTRSLLAHVYSFVFRDFERAWSLLDPVASSPPDSPIYYNVLGLLRLYTGQVDAAAEAGAIARRCGRTSPLNFSFVTTACMAEAVRGKPDQAIRYGEEALAIQRGRKVVFEPTLRYLGFAYAQRGDWTKARDVLRQIKSQVPGFSWKSFEDERFPVPAPELRSLMRDGFRKIGTV